MSAFGGKADIERDPSQCLLLTQSGHWWSTLSPAHDQPDIAGHAAREVQYLRLQPETLGSPSLEKEIVKALGLALKRFRPVRLTIVDGAALVGAQLCGKLHHLHFEFTSFSSPKGFVTLNNLNVKMRISRTRNCLI